MRKCAPTARTIRRTVATTARASYQHKCSNPKTTPPQQLNSKKEKNTNRKLTTIQISRHRRVGKCALIITTFLSTDSTSAGLHLHIIRSAPDPKRASGLAPGRVIATEFAFSISRAQQHNEHAYCYWPLCQMAKNISKIISPN